MIGIQEYEFAYMPIGELSDIVEMYQRIEGYAEADGEINGDFIPSLKQQGEEIQDMISSHVQEPQEKENPTVRSEKSMED